MTLPTPAQYWLATGSITLTPNAEGNPNLMQVQTPADACLLAYMPNVPELDYDVNHNFRKWYIKSSNVCFGSDTLKYVYLRIPRTQAAINADPEAVDAAGNPLTAPSDQRNAELCYPSDHIDIYGCIHTNEYSTSDVKTQVGSRQYLYIFLQGIISANTGTRTLQQPINFGTLSVNFFTRYDGACTVNSFDNMGLRYIEPRLDGRTIYIDSSMVASGDTGAYIILPSPKDYDGQSFDIKIMHSFNGEYTFDLFCPTFDGMASKEIGPSGFKSYLFYAPLDVTRIKDGYKHEPLYTTLVGIYGRATLTITSVRTHRDPKNPEDDWAWEISNFRPSYTYQGLKAYRIYAGTYESDKYNTRRTGIIALGTIDGWCPMP